MSDQEHWRPVVGFPGYFVSSLGRVVNKGGDIQRAGSPPDWSNGKCHRGTTGHVMRTKVRYMTIFLHRNRPHVMLSRDKKSHNLSVINLIAEAFVGPTPEGYQVEVKNGVKGDARLTNLCYRPYEAPWTKCHRAVRAAKAARAGEAAE